jgi:hypothetical protein
LLLNMEEWGMAAVVVLGGAVGWGVGLLWRYRGEQTVESVAEGGDQA